MTPRGMGACAFCYLEHTIGATMRTGDESIASITSVHLYPPQHVVLTRTRQAGVEWQNPPDRRELYRMLHPNF